MILIRGHSISITSFPRKTHKNNYINNVKLIGCSIKQSKATTVQYLPMVKPVQEKPIQCKESNHKPMYNHN